MANADGEEVNVENVVEVEVKTEGNVEASVEPAYVMEIEVNADGQVIKQTAAHKVEQQSTDGNFVLVPEPAVQESVDVKSTHNYLQPQQQQQFHPASSNTLPMAVSNNVEISNTTGHIVDQRLLENLVKGNKSVSVVQESGQVIIVLGQNSELSQSDIEAIKFQVAKTEQKGRIQNIQRTEDIASIPEPSCFTEQTSENSSFSAKPDDTGQVRICHQCQAQFNSPNELVYHFVQEHSTSVQCQYCDVVSPSIVEANQHKKQRHIELQCTMCKKTYYGTISLKQHIKLRHSKSSKCGCCYQYFDTREEMEEHIEQVHKFHKCMFCGKGFYFQTSLGNHIESEHGLSTMDNVVITEKPTHNHQTVQNLQNGKADNTPAENEMDLLGMNSDESRPSQSHSMVTKMTKSRVDNSHNVDTKITKPAELQTNSVRETSGSRKSPRRSSQRRSDSEAGISRKTDLSNGVETVHDTKTTVDTNTVRDLVNGKNGIEAEELDSKKKLNDTTAKLRRSSRGPKNQPHLIKEETTQKIVNGANSSPLRKSPRKRTTEESPKRPKKKSGDLKNGDLSASGNSVCEYCSQVFKTERTFSVHRKDNWKRCSVAMGCSYCESVFLTTKELVTHHKRSHRRKPIHLK